MMKLSSPWAIFYRKIESLFIEDPEVTVVFDDETPEVKLYVDNAVKADAIANLLPVEKVFGNVTLKITVVPANNEDIGNLFRTAFNGNPALCYVQHFDTQLTGPMDCVVFQNKVVQYFNDDLYDIHGICSTLYQDIAKDVFELNGQKVSYCTALPDEEQ